VVLVGAATSCALAEPTTDTHSAFKTVATMRLAQFALQRITLKASIASDFHDVLDVCHPNVDLFDGKILFVF
jgi:hypothetical protein